LRITPRSRCHELGVGAPDRQAIFLRAAGISISLG
jgi:hypothetical protein